MQQFYEIDELHTSSKKIKTKKKLNDVDIQTVKTSYKIIKNNVDYMNNKNHIKFEAVLYRNSYRGYDKNYISETSIDQKMYLFLHLIF